MLVKVFTFKVSLAGINVSIIVLIEIILNSIFCHGVTSIWFRVAESSY
jgi:hypothetical protein